MDRVTRSAFLATTALSILSGLVSETQAQGIDYGDIDQNRLPPEGWSEYSFDDPGGWSTINVTQQGISPNTPSQDAAAELSAIIANNPGRIRLYFPAGDYYLKSNLIINRGDIWIDGDGVATELILDAPSNEEMNIRFTGSAGSSVVVTESVEKGENVLDLASTSTFVPGGFANVFMSNSGLKSNFAAGQVVPIASVGSGMVTLADQIAIPMTSGQAPSIEPLNMISNIRITNLSIDRLRDNADYLNGSQFTWSHNIHLIYVENFEIDNVTSRRSANHHVEARYTYGGVIKNSDFAEGYDYGGGGHGYGVNLTRNATKTTVINNDFTSLRHDVTLHFGANQSVIAYNAATDSKSGGRNAYILHGRGAHSNLFEGNLSTFDVVKDCAHEDDLAGNFFFRNKSRDVGDECGTADAMNILANEYSGNLKDTGSGNYIGANVKGSTVSWGDLPTDADLPASLYTTVQPSFVSAWPLYGPAAGGAVGPTLTFEAESLVRSVSGATARVISDAGASNGEWVLFEANGPGNQIDFTIPELPAGTYDVAVRYKRYWKRGIAQTETNGGALIGSPFDYYGTNIAFVTADVGSATYTAGGDETLRFEVTGKNSSASEFHLSIDRLEFTAQAPTSIVYEAEDLPYSTTGATAREITDSGASQGAWVLFESDGVGDVIDFTVPELVSGPYDIYVTYKRYTKRGMAQVETGNSTLVGSPLDMYGTNIAFIRKKVGTVNYAPGGDESIRFRITGKDPSALNFNLSIDQIEFVPN